MGKHYGDDEFVVSDLYIELFKREMEIRMDSIQKKFEWELEQLRTDLENGI